MSDKPAIELPPIDDLLHGPARLRLMAILSAVKRTDFTYLLNLTGMSRGNLSAQMSRLEDAELVQINKVFESKRPKTIYQITTKGRKALRVYKQNMTTILSAISD